MTIAAPAHDTPRWKRYLGRFLSGFAALFLAFDAVMKLFANEEAVRATTDLGWSADALVGLALVQLICLAVYLVPRTAVIGALLWTGYLGGAVATHVRVDNPWPSHSLFPIYVALFLWGGLYLRDARVRGLFVAHDGSGARDEA